MNFIDENANFPIRYPVYWDDIYLAKVEQLDIVLALASTDGQLVWQSDQPCDFGEGFPAGHEREIVTKCAENQNAVSVKPGIFRLIIL